MADTQYRIDYKHNWYMSNRTRIIAEAVERNKVWVAANKDEYYRKKYVRNASNHKFGSARKYHCLDCISEGRQINATQWDHWDGYDKPESIWHIEPVCQKHNRLREVQRSIPWRLGRSA